MVVRVADEVDGEHVRDRVVFEQVLRTGSPSRPRLDATPAAGAGASGVVPCAPVQHLAVVDHVAVSGTTGDRVVDHVDHPHEHVTGPARVTGDRRTTHPASTTLRTHPTDPAWASAAERSVS